MRHGMWVGTYPVAGASAPAGAGEGIWFVDGHEAVVGPGPGLTARQVTNTPAPSFLALSPDGSTLFAVGETSPGMVLAFAVGADGSLTERARVTSGGADPCHLLVHPTGHTLYVSQYSSGSLAVLPLEPHPGGGWTFVGGVRQLFEHSGAGPHERQAGPHVHSALRLPAEGGDVLIALDLGTDELRRYRVAPDGALSTDEIAGRLPWGSGPRHAAVTSTGQLLVVAELSAELFLLAWDPVTATVSPLDRVALAERPALPSHVSVVAGEPGDVALVGVRATERTAGDAPDGIAVVDVTGERLELRGRIPTASWPRHHVVAGGRLWVAGQEGHEVQGFALPGAAPFPGPEVTLPVPSPAHLLVR